MQPGLPRGGLEQWFATSATSATSETLKPVVAQVAKLIILRGEIATAADLMKLQWMKPQDAEQLWFILSVLGRDFG